MKYKLVILMLISIIALSTTASASLWITETELTAGLADAGDHSNPAYFEYNGDTFLIVGSRDTGFDGYKKRKNRVNIGV